MHSFVFTSIFMLLHGLYCLEIHIGENFMIPHFYFCDVYCPYLLFAYYVSFPLFLHCLQPLVIKNNNVETLIP